MRIIEIMGPDAAVVLPIAGDGGRERVIESVARNLSQTLGVSSVALIAQEGSRLDGVDILPVKLSDGLHPALVLQEIFQTYGSSLSCDILHVHHPSYMEASKFIRARKTVLTHHGAIDHPNNFSADGVTFVSQFLRRWMNKGRSLGGDPAIAVIYNPVAIGDRIAARDQKGPIGFLGAVEKPVKRVDIALKLALATTHPIMVAGPCSPDFLSRCLLPNLAPHSRYLGTVSGPERKTFFESISCMVVPSDPPEAFCLVAAEAMANGVPVIGSAFGAIPEVVEDGVSGYLCEGLDDYIAAFGRIDLIASEDCQMSVARRFDPAKISKEYFEFFSELK